MKHVSHLSRRSFLGSAAATLAVNATALLWSQQNAQPHIPNRDTMLKFNPDGSSRPFAGNTIISHLPVQCDLRDEMTKLHEALAVSPFVGALGLTAIASYHMTVFNGADDLARKATGWPSYVPLEASMAECNRLVLERMSKLVLECPLPIRMKLDQQATLNAPTALALRLVPADAGEIAKLKSVRRQLATTYGLPLAQPDTYSFHITMSYQVRAFTTDESVQYQTMLRAALQRIAAAVPIIELGEPEFCTFPDMQRFDPVLLLRTA